MLSISNANLQPLLDFNPKNPTAINLLNPLEQRLQLQLSARQKEERLRGLYVPSPGLIDFCSNDYLGLASNFELRDNIEAAFSTLKTRFNGSTGSRLISGNSELAQEVEKELAQIFRSESCLLFSSGYAANLAMISSIATKDDTIIYDELAHACIKDGARLSLAKRFSFRHNDIQDLKQKLYRAQGQKFVVIESVYSMDGDFCPLPELIALAKQEDVHLIIDEAHGTSVYGQNGSGWVCQQGLEENFFARTYTFGKGAGIHGACIVGSDLLMQYLVNFSRPFIYTTAMSPHGMISVRESFRYQSQNPLLQQKLQSNIVYFRSTLEKYSWDGPAWIDSLSAIQAFIIPSNKAVKNVAKLLQQQGFDVRPILSPTVKEGEERLRICLHNYNTEEQIAELIKQIHSAHGI